METKKMRLLTQQEMQSSYGGSFFSGIISWFKRHFFHEKVDEHSWESISKPGYNGTDMYGMSFDF